MLKYFQNPYLPAVLPAEGRKKSKVANLGFLTNLRGYLPLLAVAQKVFLISRTFTGTI
jgi:hypothetical protein